jgi:hypothetical protein
MADGFRIKVHGLEQATAEMKSAIHAGEVSGMEKLVALGEMLVKQNINSPYDGMPAAVATGNLVNAVHGELHEDEVLRAIIAAGPPADVYALPVEAGTKPHFPPPSMLIPWVKLKFHPKSDKEALSIAFAVAKTIAKRGTRGHEMFERALPELESNAQGIIESEIARALHAEGFAV